MRTTKSKEKIWEFFRNTAVQIGAMLFALTTALTIYNLQISNNRRVQNETKKHELQFLIFTRTTRMLEALNDFRDLPITNFIPRCLTSQTVIYDDECSASSKSTLDNIKRDRENILFISDKIVDEFQFSDDFRNPSLMREQISLRSLVLNAPFGNILELGPLPVYADVDQPYQDLLIREHGLAAIVKALRTVTLFEGNRDTNGNTANKRDYIEMVSEFNRVRDAFQAGLIDYLERYCVLAGAAQKDPNKTQAIFASFSTMVKQYIESNHEVHTTSPLDWRYAYALDMYGDIGPKFIFLDSNCGDFISKRKYE